MGDPLFERRALVRNIHIDSRFLQRNIQASLLAQLRLKYEGVCVAEGYIQRRSITIVEHSLGRTNLIKGGLDYTVKFQADVCMPHPGQVFRVPVTLKSKIGIHAEMTPVKALLPRDIHIGVEEFEQIKEKEEIEFEVVGARFQQGDDSIVVLGKLRNVILPSQDTGVSNAAAEPQVEPQLIAASVGNGDNERKTVTVDVASTKPTSAAPARKRTVRLNPNAIQNEPVAKGTTEGKSGEA
jgi:DNA-directed RNA polymerase subunit E'/Rpb7